MENNEGVSFIVLVEKQNHNLRTQLKTMTTVCNELGCNYEVIVLFKKQNDELGEIVESVQNAYKIKHEVINFYPSALRTGLKQAKHEKVLISCSDNIITTNSMKQMVIVLEYYDLVCGIRPVLPRGLRAAVYTWGWRKLVRFLFNVRLKDINCPYKGLLRSKAKNVGFLESNGTLTHTELVARIKAMGMKIAELPLESFHLESEKAEAHNPFILAWT